MNEYTFQIDRFSLMTSLLNVVNENSRDAAPHILALYFLKHFDELDRLNIYDVAEACFISRSSVQRFCKAIGFDTFSTLKINTPVERELHKTSFIAYADRPDFPAYARTSMSEMMHEIEYLAEKQDLADFARSIHDSGHTALLTSEYSSMAPRDLQQELFVAGKLVALITDSHPDFGLLHSLAEGDLLIVCSATGNYAYAIDEEIRRLAGPRRVLITVNRDKLFRETYQTVFYLSEYADDRQRSVYTKYGMGYFLDLLYSTYIRRYYQK